MSYWCIGSRNYELVLERMLYEQRFRLTEGALNYGIAYGRHYFNELQKKHEHMIDLDEYAQILDARYRIQLIFLSQKKSILIKAIAYDNLEKMCCLQCKIQRKNTNSFEIAEWAIA